MVEVKVKELVHIHPPHTHLYSIKGVYIENSKELRPMIQFTKVIKDLNLGNLIP